MRSNKNRTAITPTSQLLREAGSNILSAKNTQDISVHKVIKIINYNIFKVQGRLEPVRLLTFPMSTVLTTQYVAPGAFANVTSTAVCPALWWRYFVKTCTVVDSLSRALRPRPNQCQAARYKARKTMIPHYEFAQGCRPSLLQTGTSVRYLQTGSKLHIRVASGHANWKTQDQNLSATICIFQEPPKKLHGRHAHRRPDCVGSQPVLAQVTKVTGLRQLKGLSHGFKKSSEKIHHLARTSRGYMVLEVCFSPS